MTERARKVEDQPVFRPVIDADAQDLFGLLSLCYAEYPGCFVDPHDDLPDLRAAGSSYAATDGAFWAVEDERGRVCACVAVDFPERGAAELHRLYVRSDRRGQGLGSLLVRQAENHARARGADRIVLWSDTRFRTAHRLYRRLGYTQVDGQRQLADISKSAEYRFEKTF
ncbi:GNAT family N-acetyltransferase [Microvirga sp. 3-52]|uniref:GNAT family N-acetyltransferase n=1 Tax=Microvirga sp. 3-52 TaxID=2792425 RepID=UPI001AC6D853|nr:GNAT family N-acetyltransferase [Microvirga sp. 3-52]MBO1906536.1 GNAT family N-acetyltransferase [Microvirga sp. 3-52]MBS7453748.1 GNAT family N-acetyltransferase [Microvirga sp. 3-52]